MGPTPRGYVGDGGPGTVAVVAFAIGALLRWTQGRDDVTGTQIALTVVGLLLVSVSGWLGGKLAYHYGVRVADEQTQSTGFRTAPD